MAIIMKFAIFALAVCVGMSVFVEPSVYDKPGHAHDLRMRLGHFKEQPFTDLYHQYAAAFVYPKHMHERPMDDYRNYMPSGEECELYLKAFRINKYQMNDLEDFVILDACLGYLFDSDDHSQDSETKDEVKQVLSKIKEDDTVLKELYQSKINELDGAATNCVADLLLSNILAKKQFPDVQCNNHILQMYIQFAECEKETNLRAQGDDPYIKLMIEIVNKRASFCFDTEINLMNNAVREAFAKNTYDRTSNRLRKFFGKGLATQSLKRMWPQELTTLLAAVQRPKKQVNIRLVHQYIKGVYDKDEKLTSVFLDNIAKFAQSRIKPGANKKFDRMDPYGSLRYTDLIDKICAFFRSSDSESQYDFATPFIRMNELLRHSDLFKNITLERFRNAIITKNARESSPLYLGASACNILTFTEGSLPQDNTKKQYKVAFVPDTSRMVRWPDAGFY